MIVQAVNCYLGGVSSYSGAGYAVVSKSADQPTGGAGGQSTLGRVSYDTVSHGDAALFNDTNDSFVIPAGFSGFARLFATVVHPDVFSTFYKNGASFVGTGVQHCAANFGRPNGASAIVAVSPGDAFTQSFPSGAGLSPLSWTARNAYAIELLPPTIKYGLFTKSANQAVASGGTIPILFQTEVADTENLHSTVTNTSRITFTSSQIVRLTGQLNFNLAGGAFDYLALFLKNNTFSLYPGWGYTDSGSGSVRTMNICSAIISVVNTDFFELAMNNASTCTVLANDNTWLQYEVLDPATKYVHLTRTTSQALTANVGANLAFNSTVANTAAASIASGVITVPSGVTKARCSFNVLGDNVAAAPLEAYALKNGSYTYGMPSHGQASASNDIINSFGSWVDVTPGDTISLWVQSSVNNNVIGDHRSWLCVEFA